MARIKLNKTEVERRVQASIERHGGTYLYVNWKKRTVHFISPKGVRMTDLLFTGVI